jgi:hypothetical protein
VREGEDEELARSWRGVGEGRRGGGGGRGQANQGARVDRSAYRREGRIEFKSIVL